MNQMVRVRNDVVFASAGGRDLCCDVYEPEESGEARPAVLLLHGGAWRAGSRDMVEGFGRRLAEAGFVAVASEYRLTPEAPWPAQIDDVRAALGWIRANAASMNVDDSRIAVLGRSAGGHLALLAAGTDSRVGAAIGIFPPTTFYAEERTRGGVPAKALMGESATVEGARQASPLAFVGPEYPPTFLLHGTDDKIVPPSASMVMYEALVAAGVPVELHMYAGQPHGFVASADFHDLCANEIAHFLHRFLTARSQEEVPILTR
jgi:acetyl esterase/lipase